MVAVGSITETRGKFAPPRTPVLSVRLAWTSSAGGAVSGILSTGLNGVLSRVTFVPGAGGVQPTDQYDVTLLDADGIDILGGQGANLSNASGSSVLPLVGVGSGLPAVVGTVELRVANAGAAKSGTVVLYFLEVGAAAPPVFAPQNIVTAGAVGSGAMFQGTLNSALVQRAVNFIPTSGPLSGSATMPWLVRLLPGFWNFDDADPNSTAVAPAGGDYVFFEGSGRDATVVKRTNSAGGVGSGVECFNFPSHSGLAHMTLWQTAGRSHWDGGLYLLLEDLYLKGSGGVSTGIMGGSILRAHNVIFDGNGLGPHGGLVGDGTPAWLDYDDVTHINCTGLSYGFSAVVGSAQHDTYVTISNVRNRDVGGEPPFNLTPITTKQIWLLRGPGAPPVNFLAHPDNNEWNNVFEPGGISEYFTQPPVPIVSMSQANPTLVTTSVPHGMRTGQQCSFDSTNCTPTPAGYYQIQRVDDTSFLAIGLNVTVAGNAGNVDHSGVPDEGAVLVFDPTMNGGAMNDPRRNALPAGAAGAAYPMVVANTVVGSHWRPLKAKFAYVLPDGTFTQGHKVVTSATALCAHDDNTATDWATVILGEVDFNADETSPYSGKAITAISAAGPTHVTAVGHGLVTNNKVNITGSNSTPVIDGVHQVTVIDADHFTIPVTVTGAGNAGTAWGPKRIRLNPALTSRW